STTTTTSSTSPFPPTSENSNLNTWIFPIIVISFFVILSIIVAFIIISKKRKKNIDTNNLQHISIEDKDGTDNSKTNSLTSSINSISSSFRMKKGKIVPGDVNVSSGSPPVPILTDNNDEEEEKPKMPTLKRTQTTVSAFKEIVDLTDEENDNLRKSVNS